MWNVLSMERGAPLATFLNRIALQRRLKKKKKKKKTKKKAP